jgi:uncharacterized cupin superfamily protein
VVSGYQLKAIDELESIHGGMVKLAGAELGVESFGMQVLDFPAGFAHYPEHDHGHDGQEEVYVVLRGEAQFTIDGERSSVRAGEILRIPPSARRHIEPGSDGVRILAIGRAVDRAYERPEDFRLAVRA